MLSGNLRTPSPNTLKGVEQNFFSVQRLERLCSHLLEKMGGEGGVRSGVLAAVYGPGL